MRANVSRRAVAGREIDVLYLDAGAPGPPVVFLHEGLGSIELWRTFPRDVCERAGRNAIVYSRYGNGFSEALEAAREPSYMHDEALALDALLDAFAVDRAVLVGHSDGASIALIFAARRPERVAGVVAIAPHAFVEDVSVRSIAEIGRAYRESNLRERMSPHHADVDRTFYGWNDIWLRSDFRSWNVEAEVASIVAPMLCVQGTDDEYGTLAQVESIARRAPRAVDRLLLARCGHAPHRSRPEIVTPSVGSWIAALEECVQ